MYDFARTLGLVHLATGVFLLAFPNYVRPMIRARAEYALLSDNALRLLGIWALFMGGAMVGLPARRSTGATVGEITSAPHRRVAA